MLKTDRIDEGTYQDIAVQMRRYCAASYLQQDLKQLFMRLIFNILCNNSDDHLRNHGFIYAPGLGWRLSPAYDIVPQPDMGLKQPRLLTLGVGMNGSREATLQNAISSCAVFGLSEQAAQAITNQMKRLFISQWEGTFSKYGVPVKDFPALAQAFVNHLQ